MGSARATPPGVRPGAPGPCRGGRLQSSRPPEATDTARPISLVLDIGQGAGLAGASGVRPFLPPLLAGGLASADVGLDFDGTSWEFLERPPFLLVVVVLAAASYALDRRAAAARHPGDRGDDDPARAGDARDEPAPRRNLVEAAMALPAGMLLFAASLAEGGHPDWPGLVAGAACALLGYFSVALLLARARARVEAGAAGLFDLYAAAFAVALAAVAILLPPAGYVALAGFALLAVRARAAAGRKYQGLRILR